ncbi:hypothetical protein [Streptococcus pneumoniae]|uniref:hypothetical protein n=1 Tax=Streptococcus pneumoniae TaxID=1313 RepID=UPI000A9414BE|nr:hypothetical protein [Streptococcus pneumoniae]
MSTDETLYTLRKSLQTSSASPCRMYGFRQFYLQSKAVGFELTYNLKLLVLS